jgi:hypothetical protein
MLFDILFHNREYADLYLCRAAVQLDKEGKRVVLLKPCQLPY